MTGSVPVGKVRDWLLAGVAIAFLAVVRAGVLQERDPYWQVRAGTENLAGLPTIRPDSWSWAPVEGPFVQTSPWWNDVLALAWQAGGFAGFFAVGFASVLCYGLIALGLSRALGARGLPALAGVLVAVLPVLPMLSPRGALVAQTLFLLAMGLAHLSVPHLARIATPVGVVALASAGFGVAVLGIGIHLSWAVLAPALVVAVVILLSLTPSVPARRTLAFSAALAVGLGAGVVSGPYGIQVFRLSRRVQDAASGVVLEWLPTWTPGLWPRWVPVATLALALCAGSAAWLWRHRDLRDDGRLPLAAALLCVAAPAAVAGFFTIRVLGLALLTMAPLVAAGATVVVDRLRLRAFDPGSRAHPRLRHWMGGRPWRVVVTTVLVLVSPLVFVAGSRLGRPVAETAALASLPEGCRLVSDPNAAGAVLLLRPDVPVWIDTRADYWGRERNAEAIRLITEGVDRTGALDRATCAMLVDNPGLPPSALAARLDADPSWSRVHADGAATVWTAQP
ncbi:hypothetical protein [uncultured Phycicoccus sp.]|uniref:hypothetical protein n=1 Tax=uncultured Phycicoccus sp. TaxID=661422 RepID=UPI0026308A86|nr:hypothetical protein [uncultured Phycicoccus sp.]